MALLTGASHRTPWKITRNTLAIRHGTDSHLVLSALQTADEAGPYDSAAGAHMACPRCFLLRAMLTRRDQKRSR